ncbi:hypothetical protein PSAC2689_20395 [Paraburkholderia sacchari]
MARKRASRALPPAPGVPPIYERRLFYAMWIGVPGSAHEAPLGGASLRALIRCLPRVTAP